MYKSSTLKLGPETQLLISCARTLLDSVMVDQIRTLAQGQINWKYLTSLACTHRLEPLLYWNLQAVCPNAVPPEVIAYLRYRFQTTAQYNLELTRELVNLLQLFTRHNIPALPYKGPVLAVSIYGNLALRQFGDLDILIHPHNVPQVQNLLTAHGYQALPPSSAVDYHCRFEYQHQHPKYVEIHWQTAQHPFPMTLDLSYFWPRTTPLTLAGETIPCFSPEDLLLVLCAHGAKHHWSRLSWICDVAELLRLQPALNWDWLIAQAHHMRGERILWLGLAVAGGLLGAPLPPSIEVRVKADQIVKLLAAQINEWLFAESDIPHKRLERYDFYLKTPGYWPARLAYRLHLTRQKVFPNSKDRAFLPLPTWLSFFYWLLRPVRLVRDYGLSRSRLTYLLHATAQDFRDAW